MAPNIPRLRAYLVRLVSTIPSEKTCDVCDAEMPSRASTYSVTGIETLVTSASASECPHLSLEESEHQTCAWGCIAEREAMALEGGVSSAFARMFAALQVACPANVDQPRWHQAIDDVGVFLDTWGRAAERLGWSARDVNGPQCSLEALAWVLNGAQVNSLTRTGALLSDGRTFVRTTKVE
jgi:hypothetical protein